MNLFGFQLGKRPDEDPDAKENLPSIVPPNQDDGSIEIAPGGSYGTYVDLEGKAKNEGQLVTKYRQMALFPECDSAIQDIVNEAIVIDEEGPAVEIVLDDVDELSDSIKNKIRDEFENVLELLNFNSKGYDIFKKWYVDGRLYHHIVIDEKSPAKGIRDIRNIDPRKIRKIKEQKKEKDQRTGAMIVKKTLEYYMFNPKGINEKASSPSTTGIRIAADSISFVHSGILDESNSLVYSHLHKAIKPLNQLRMLEDAVVIYRISRAPERRIFYIDVGNLPKMKAEQYLRDMMVKHKNRLTYDAQTGEIRDDRRFQTMLEDFWLPRREGGRGTEITTLPGGQSLGEMEDVEYFRKKLYKSLNVPITRLEAENNFNLGRASEITRDEVKFAKFITRLRARFAMLFNSLLEIQLSLKGVMTRKEWQDYVYNVRYDFQEDNHFSELKDNEILQGRMQLLQEVDQFVGKYYSEKWVKENVLRLSEDEIKEIEKDIKSEGSDEDFEAKQQNQMGGPPVQDSDAPPDAAPPQEEEEEGPVDSLDKYQESTEEEKRLLESMANFMDHMSLKD